MKLSPVAVVVILTAYSLLESTKPFSFIMQLPTYTNVYTDHTVVIHCSYTIIISEETKTSQFHSSEILAALFIYPFTIILHMIHLLQCYITHFVYIYSDVILLE